jgi:hypothetical protein
MSSRARNLVVNLVVAVSAIALSPLFGLQAAHADWHCHIHPNVAASADASGVASGRDNASHPTESAHFNFGKIEQTYTPQK